MPRPDPEKEPKRFALWTRFVTEIWTEANFVDPVFGPSTGIPSRAKMGSQGLTADGNYLSFGWSGVVASGRWAGAWGVWQVPTVSKPATPIGPNTKWWSSSWVGLDGAAGLIPGATTTDVLQAGIEQAVAPDGTPSYFAWYEWFVPNPSPVVVSKFPFVNVIPILSVPVSPGDEISVVIQYVKSNTANIGDPTPPTGPYAFGGILLVNMRTNQSVNLYLPPPTGASFAGETAEWIMECPVGGTGSLPKFTPVNFTTAAACVPYVTPSQPLPGSQAGVELQNANTTEFKDSNGIIETKVSAQPTQVEITYTG